MNYYIDFEFSEGFHKPVMGKKRHHIDLISVGIACSDGRTYSAISSEYDYKSCNDWVKHNVILKLYWKYISGDRRNYLHEYNFHKIIGQTNKAIASDILQFTHVSTQHNQSPVFYGYYSDYDWVLLCSLFGTMMNLPSGWPIYCIDLKQTLDEYVDTVECGRFSLINFDVKLNYVKNMIGFPVEIDEHDALADALWIKDLHMFLLKAPKPAYMTG